MDWTSHDGDETFRALDGARWLDRCSTVLSCDITVLYLRALRDSPSLE